MNKENKNKTTGSVSQGLAALRSLGKEEQMEVWNLARRHGLRKNDLEDKSVLVALLFRVRTRKGGFGGV